MYFNKLWMVCGFNASNFSLICDLVLLPAARKESTIRMAAFPVGAAKATFKLG